MRANCDLLVHNGFVFPDNQSDCLTVRLGVAKTDQLATPRLQLLDSLGINHQKFFVRRTAEPLDSKLVAFLRVLQMDGASLAAQQAAGAELLLDLDQPSPVDAKVMQYMITRVALLLRSYSTTLEQDEQQLKTLTVRYHELQ